jgi:hypothetical protein
MHLYGNWILQLRRLGTTNFKEKKRLIRTWNYELLSSNCGGLQVPLWKWSHAQRLEALKPADS